MDEPTIAMDREHLTLLRLHDACRGLSTDEIDALAAEGELIHAAAGDCLHSVGQKLDALYIVLSGRLEMAAMTPDGGRRTLRYLSAGDQFGALMLVSDDEIPVDVIVDEKATLLRLPSADATKLLERFPAFRRNVLQKIGFAVQDALHWRRKRTLSKIVAFIHTNARTKKLVADIASKLARSGEKIGILGDSDVRSLYGPDMPFKSLRNHAGDLVDHDEVRSSIEQWPNLERVIVDLDQLHPADEMARLVELSDSVFFISGTKEFDPVVKHLKQLLERSPSWSKKLHLVWALDKEEQIAPHVPDVLSMTTRDFKVQVSDPKTDSRLFHQGVDRIVHYLRDISIGLALSGGAAHGMAHLGVLRALDESGITIDKVAGTSAGVLTGVFYCAGYTADWGVEQFTHDLKPDSLYQWIPKGKSLYMLGKYRSGSWAPMLRKYLLDWRLEQLPIPVSTVTTDLISAQAVARSSGDAVDSILESINLPILSPPICRDGMLLVDGGIVNNLPADLLAGQGCNFVIGVDVAAHIEHHVGDCFPDTPTEKMKAPGAVATLLRCLRVQAHNMSAVGARGADVIISPDVSMIEPTDFAKTPQMAEIGYRATIETLPRIRDILHKMDGDLFSN